MVLIPIHSQESYLKYIQEKRRPPIEVLLQQIDLIEKWEPQREVWFLLHGNKILGLIAAISSLTISNLFRRKLRLGTQGIALSTVCATFGPATIVAGLHEHLIRDPIIVYQRQCPICYEVKAGILFNGLSILFPLIMTPTLNLSIASSCGLRIPSITEVGVLSKFWWSVVKPATTQLSILFAINSFFASLITYRQLLSMETVVKVLLDIEKEYEREESEKLNVFE